MIDSCLICLGINESYVANCWSDKTKKVGKYNSGFLAGRTSEYITPWLSSKELVGFKVIALLSSITTRSRPSWTSTSMIVLLCLSVCD